MVSEAEYSAAVKDHYILNWGGKPLEKRWDRGPVQDLGKSFRVLEFAPNDKRKMWTCATVGMSSPMTGQERDFKKQNGIQALEERWEEAQFDYLDPYRPSAV